MKVRSANDDDIDAWLMFRCALWPALAVDAHQEGVERVLAHANQNVALICLDDAERPIGFAEVSLRPRVAGCDTSPVAYLEALFVKQDVRRGGAANELMRAAEAWAAGRGCREFASETEVDDQTAQNVHAAIGFAEVRRTVQFKKALPPAVEQSDEQRHVSNVIAAKAPAHRGVAASNDWGDWSGSMLVHAIVAVVGGLCFFAGDVSSPDVLRGAVYPILAALCIFYVVIVLVVKRYGRQTDERNRGAELFRSDDT